jgi:hypothetical protein
MTVDCGPRGWGGLWHASPPSALYAEAWVVSVHVSLATGRYVRHLIDLGWLALRSGGEQITYRTCKMSELRTCQNTIFRFAALFEYCIVLLLSRDW